MVLSQPFPQRFHAAALGRVVAGGKEMHAHFARAVNGLLRHFTADESIDAEARRAVDKALAAAGAPGHSANMLRRVIAAVQHRAPQPAFDALLQRFAGQRLVAFPVRHQRLAGANHPTAQRQRQLRAIARAAVADPPGLILDEATSSIDTRTEALIEKGMDQLMAGRTVFVIAHRLSTVRNADAIMVLEQGQIVERGSHAELLEQKGLYYQLYHGMFELS